MKILMRYWWILIEAAKVALVCAHGPVSSDCFYFLKMNAFLSFFFYFFADMGFYFFANMGSYGSENFKKVPLPKFECVYENENKYQQGFATVIPIKYCDCRKCLNFHFAVSFAFVFIIVKFNPPPPSCFVKMGIQFSNVLYILCVLQEM